MKNNRKHIDDFFKEKLGSYSEVPPADAWSDLDKRLDTLVPHAVPTSPFRWIGHVAMVSVITVLSVSLYHKFASNSDENNSIVKEQTINKLEADNSTIDVNNNAATMAAVNIPAIGANGESENKNGNDNSANSDNSTTGVTNALAMSVNGTDGKATGKANEPNVNKNNTNTNKNKGGKAANYAPYNSGLANVKGKVNNPANVYNNSVAGGSVEEKIDEAKDGYNDNVNQYASNAKNSNSELQPSKLMAAPKMAEVKRVDNKNKTDIKIAEAKKQHQKPDFARWEAGMKGGYERGFNNTTATKYVIAPYLQYNISKKVSVMVQPGVKFANSPMRTIGSPKSYYSVNGDGYVTDNGSYRQVVLEGTTLDTTYYAKYRYTQSHDSIVKTNKAGGSYMEYELPVLFKYNVSKKVAVYGGPNVVFSQMKGVTEQTYTKASIIRTADTTIAGSTMAPAPAIGNVITYNGTPFSDYNGPLYPAPQDNRIRFGAIVGFSYEYSDRWLLDALIQQAPAPKDVRGGYNINAPLTATYFRLSVGYKLTK